MSIELTEQQISVFGRPNFLCSRVAKMLIRCGVYKDGPSKAEYEQAVCIHWSSELLRLHGDDWLDVGRKILHELEATQVRQDEQSGTWLKDSNVNGGKRQGGAA